ncbi:MAG: hypothetical protein CVT47_00450 [Thermoplasmata archaeon HGW-Thermoplasmata-2]|nr:MAG: hypothetical protein CVT47_00450 [Thermoplasmata archaeon HGW-Thermoplasmata-2]
MKSEAPLSDYPYMLHPRNTVLITTCGAAGKPNIITIAWITPISAAPPLLGFAIRKSRHSFKLLEENGEFVVNVPEFSLAPQSAFCGRESGKSVDKFAGCKLTTEKSAKVAPPTIGECAAAIECKVHKMIEVGDHVLVVGEVVGASADSKKFEGFFNSSFRPLLHVKGNVFTTSSGEEKEF